MNKLSNQDKREKIENKKDHAFIEKFAYILVFVMLVFVGMTLFLVPKEKQVFNFGKVNLNTDVEVNQEKEKVSADNSVDISKEEINSQLFQNQGNIKENTGLTTAQKAYIAEIKRQKMQANLQKQLSIAKSPQKLAHNLYKKSVPSVAQEDYTREIQGGIEYDYNVPSPPVAQAPQSEEDFSFDLSAATCTIDEMEYVLNLYTSVNSRKPITLAFRRNNPSKTLQPEVISATLPNNKWRNLESEFETVLTSIFGDIFKEESSDRNKTKVGALVTTPCSQSAYVSEPFYVSENPPQRATVSVAKNICSSRNGRLPDILELIAVLKHKNFQNGYYISNSQRMSVNKNGTKGLLNDYIVIQYKNGDVYFTTTSKIPPNQQVFVDCVLK